MNSYLLNRSLGSISPEAFQLALSDRLIRAIDPAPTVRFTSNTGNNDGEPSEDTNINSGAELYEEKVEGWAHKSGVNCLAIDRFEGRLMLSGGADPSIHLWDLQNASNTNHHCLHRPIASLTKSTPSFHTRSLTSISFFPFDTSACLTTSYDSTLKLFSVTPSSLVPAHTFSLDLPAHTHSTSTHPSSTLLVAVGTSHPAIRLLDLRSGASTHSLSGHTDSILSLAWSPHSAHILLSGAADGRALLWDIRRANACIASLDSDDAVGVLPPLSLPSVHVRPALSPKAHAHPNGPCNGVLFASHGNHIVTTGHDGRIRLWDAATGANCLVHFGPRLRNTRLATLLPLITPRGVLPQGREIIFYPNDEKGEILMFELYEGTLLKVLRVPGLKRQQEPGKVGLKGRVAALAWRGGEAAGLGGAEIYSAHGDGTIRAWISRTKEEMDLDDEESEDVEAIDRKRKMGKDVLGEIVEGLAGKNVRFT